MGEIIQPLEVFFSNVHIWIWPALILILRMLYYVLPVKAFYSVFTALALYIMYEADALSWVFAITLPPHNDRSHRKERRLVKKGALSKKSYGLSENELSNERSGEVESSEMSRNQFDNGEDQANSDMSDFDEELYRVVKNENPLS